jgi:hypothetical protein
MAIIEWEIRWAEHEACMEGTIWEMQAQMGG